MILFNLGGDDWREAAASAAYQNALLVTMICMSVARSDGEIVQEEIACIKHLVMGMPGLDVCGRNRIEAEVEWTRQFPFPLSAIFRACSSLDGAQRTAIAGSIVATVLADKQTPEAELSFARSIFKALRFADGEFELALKRSACAQTPPLRPSTAQPATTLDPEAQPSAEADELLSAIARDRVEAEPSNPSSGGSHTAGEAKISLGDTGRSATSDAAVADPDDETLAPFDIDGLSDKHVAFLRKLLRQAEWPRGAVESLARDCRVMPNGAVESINEWAFCEFEDRLLEFSEDGRLRVNPDIDINELRLVA